MNTGVALAKAGGGEEQHSKAMETACSKAGRQKTQHIKCPKEGSGCQEAWTEMVQGGETEDSRRLMLDPAESGSTLKTLCYTNSKKEPPKSFKLQSLGEVRDDRSALAMSNRVTRPSKIPHLLILTINPQVGIVNTFVGKTRRQGRQPRL